MLLICMMLQILSPAQIIKADTIADDTIITGAFTDSNFLEAIRENWNVPDTGDITYGDIKDMNYLYINNRNITSLAGIEYFTELTNLDVSYNLIEALDVSALPNLSYISLYDNPLKSINISGTKITSLYFYNYQGNPGMLEALNVTNCAELTQLNLGYQQLTELDLAGCVALESLSISGNPLETLNLTGCTSLTYISTDLDVSNIIGFDSIYAQLTNVYLDNETMSVYAVFGEKQVAVGNISKNIPDGADVPPSDSFVNLSLRPTADGGDITVKAYIGSVFFNFGWMNINGAIMFLGNTPAGEYKAFHGSTELFTLKVFANATELVKVDGLYNDSSSGIGYDAMGQYYEQYSDIFSYGHYGGYSSNNRIITANDGNIYLKVTASNNASITAATLNHGAAFATLASNGVVPGAQTSPNLREYIIKLNITGEMPANNTIAKYSVTVNGNTVSGYMQVDSNDYNIAVDIENGKGRFSYIFDDTPPDILTAYFMIGYNDVFDWDNEDYTYSPNADKVIKEVTATKIADRVYEFDIPKDAYIFADEYNNAQLYYMNSDCENYIAVNMSSHNVINHIAGIGGMSLYDRQEIPTKIDGVRIERYFSTSYGKYIENIPMSLLDENLTPVSGVTIALDNSKGYPYQEIYVISAPTVTLTNGANYYLAAYGVALFELTSNSALNGMTGGGSGQGSQIYVLPVSPGSTFELYFNTPYSPIDLSEWSVTLTNCETNSIITKNFATEFNLTSNVGNLASGNANLTTKTAVPPGLYTLTFFRNGVQINKNSFMHVSGSLYVTNEKIVEIGTGWHVRNTEPYTYLNVISNDNNVSGLTINLYKTNGTFVDYSAPHKTIPVSKSEISASETGVTEPGAYYAVTKDASGKVVNVSQLVFSTKWIQGLFEVSTPSEYSTVSTSTPVNLKPGSAAFSEIKIESNGSVARITATLASGSLAGLNMYAAAYEDGKLIKLYPSSTSEGSLIINGVSLTNLSDDMKIFIWDSTSLEPYIK